MGASTTVLLPSRDSKSSLPLLVTDSPSSHPSLPSHHGPATWSIVLLAVSLSTLLLLLLCTRTQMGEVTMARLTGSEEVTMDRLTSSEEVTMDRLTGSEEEFTGISTQDVIVEETSEDEDNFEIDITSVDDITSENYHKHHCNMKNLLKCSAQITKAYARCQHAHGKKDILKCIKAIIGAGDCWKCVCKVVPKLC